MERDTFIFRRKWYEAIKALDTETKVKVFDTICEYALYHNTEIPTAPMVQMAMAFVIPELEADCDKWLDTIKARSEAGKKGMEKRWGKKEQPITNDSKCYQELSNDNKEYQEVTKIADNVFSIVNDNVNFLFSNGQELPKEKKEEIIFEIGKKILLRGYKKPITEAKAFYNHNSSIGWTDGKGRKIQDILAWLDGWKCKDENYSQAIHDSAEEFLAFITAGKITNPDVLEGFRGIQKSEICVSFIMTAKGVEAMEESITEDVLAAKKLYFGNLQIGYKKP